MKRAFRRRQLSRLKAKARRLWGDHPKATHYANYMTPCSCPGCGNPRRHFGERTIQERKAGVTTEVTRDGDL